MPIYPLAACLVALVAVGASAMRLRRVGGAIGTDPSALARLLRRPDHDDAVGRLHRLAEEARNNAAHWEAELLEDVTVVADHRARARLVNQHLDELARELDWGVRIPMTAGRASFFGAFSVLFFEAAAGKATFGSLAAILGWGLSGLIVARAIGALADELADRHRRAIDDLVEAALWAASRPPHGPVPASGTDLEPKGESAST